MTENPWFTLFKTFTVVWLWALIELSEEQQCFNRVSFYHMAFLRKYLECSEDSTFSLPEPPETEFKVGLHKNKHLQSSDTVAGAEIVPAAVCLMCKTEKDQINKPR